MVATGLCVWLQNSVLVSSPTTLLVSRNVAIDCVQLQVRVHSAQQQTERLLLASLLLSKNDSIVCTSRAFLPASAKCPPSLDQSNCSLYLYMWRQNGYYAILADNDLINSYPCNHSTSTGDEATGTHTDTRLMLLSA